ncbi:hypothetical protein CsSME_00028252 [Camellia sinensis var. sinensis]
MGSRIWICLLVVSVQILLVAAQTNNDYIALIGLKEVWQNTPPNWVGSDPCGNGWDGIRCNNSRVTSITLASMGLVGQLSGDIQLLSELQTLDLSYNMGLTGSLPPVIGQLKKLTNLILVGCGFSGPIPDTIGSLQQLRILSLNSNSFTGNIPPAIGNLSKLYWLDLADNKLEGPIPVSPGLDMLVNTKHFHFGKNNLSGEIPSKLFSSKMTLIHVLFESNSLWGSIPSTLGLVHTLEVLRLDRNLLIGPVPSNLNNLVHVQELFLSNNRLTGPLPNLTGMTLLNYVDMSNNTFDVSYFPPWFSTLKSLTTLMMESTQLQGSIPVTLFSLPQLQTVVLRTNQLNGTLDVGSSYSEQLRLIDLQNNLVVSIGDFAKIANGKIKIILARNPVCEETGVTEAYCTIQQPNSSYTTLPDNCTPVMCSSNQISSPHCRCAYPYHDDYLVLSVEFFPYGEDRFNRTGISGIGFVFSNQTFKPNNVTFGPYFFIGDLYEYFAEGTKRKSLSIGIIIGAAIGGSVLVLLSLLAGIYAFRQKRRAEIADKQNNPFASWEQNKRSGDVPHLKGARSFSFEELKKYTNNFSEGNVIGAGGYGKVYRGALPTGQLVAVKRAQQGSMQGGHEFKTEIELLSRVHHKNVVSLLGFCFEKVEHMLVYEYIPNGTLKESLSGKTGIRLDWMRRLRIALGVARGLQYLHELANPPIIHRDIKSNNILLDECLNAKVSDFGLSKLMGDVEKGHVTTQVKGTMGYMDPEYYMTQQLTEKSDVYSFGVLMLELVTARQPIEKGKYIVREVKLKMDKTQVRYNLHDLLDPTILDLTLGGLDKFVDLAMKCVEDAGAERPTMGEVVNEIENIMRIAGLNPNADSASTSASHEVDSRGYNHPYSDDSLFVYSGAFPPSKLEPQ